MKNRQKNRQIFYTFLSYSFPISFLFLSPIIPFEGIFHEGKAGIVTGSLLVFAFLFIISIFLGRLYCGWICPGGAFQETLCSYSNNKEVNSKFDKIKFVIWVPWLGGIIVSFFIVGGIKAINFTFNTHFGSSFSIWGAYTIIYMIVAIIVVIISLLVGRRGFCHSTCWMAPFMILGKKTGSLMRLPHLTLKADASKCINCKICSKKCSMSLDVYSMVMQNKIDHSECILCGVCVDVCPKNVISYTFKKPDSL